MTISISPSFSLQDLKTVDTPDIFQLVEANRPLLEKYLYWAEGVTDLSTTKKYIEDRVNSGLEGAQWLKFVFEGETVGVFGIKSVCASTGEAEVGYWLSQHAQGKGLVTQAMEAVIHLLRERGAKCLVITCLEQNKASIAVAERVGASHVETKPNYLTLDGNLQDLFIYSLALG
ncbi:MAG: GNAT family N-acetyltransferase [Thalassotalea sp.]|nr:GNAT family N-acetyltransferase [Thalassotalea sp.]